MSYQNGFGGARGNLVVATRKLKDGLEGIGKIVTAVEIFASIRLGPFHVFDADQVVNDFAKIACGEDSPAIEYRFCHEPILIQRILPNRLAQLLTGNMLLAFASLGRHFQYFLRIGQGLAHELVSFDVIALILLQQFNDGMHFFRCQLRHLFFFRHCGITRVRMLAASNDRQDVVSMNHHASVVFHLYQ